MNTKELKEISRRVYEGKADSSEMRIYNYYIGCWGM